MFTLNEMVIRALAPRSLISLVFFDEKFCSTWNFCCVCSYPLNEEEGKTHVQHIHTLTTHLKIFSYHTHRHEATSNHCHINQRFHGLAFLRMPTPEHWIYSIKCWHSIQTIEFPLKRLSPIHTWNSITIQKMR